MLAALPVATFAAILLWFASRAGLRLAFLKAAVVCGLVVVAITEVLSLFGLLSALALAGAWILIGTCAVVGVWRNRATIAERWRLRSLERTRTLILAGVPVGLILVATGVIALVAPPNTYDSMAYHMARVSHWAADGTVAAYPTNAVRQLYYPPFAEYAILHLQLLSGGDHLANGVQWLSMLGSLVAVSLIARQLGSPPEGQALAAVVVVTLPMGILQATSTQTDYVLAFWLACSVFFAFAFIAEPKPSGAAWFASSLGLAMMTKGTAYLFAAPLVILLGAWMLIRLGRRALVPVVIMMAIPLAINAGYYARNEAIFHSPLATDTPELTNSQFAPQVTLSNLVRDSMLQMGTPSKSLNLVLERAVARVHSQVLHIGLNDPRTTWTGSTFHVYPPSFDEDYAGDPLQALLAVVTGLVAIGLAFRRGPPALTVYSIGLFLALLAFASYLRWQPWHARLELPLLVAAAPLSAAVVSRFTNTATVTALGAVLLIAAVPWVVDNQTRPLVDFWLPGWLNPVPRPIPTGRSIFNAQRSDLYFVKAPYLEAPYVLVAKQAAEQRCREIALWSGPDDWEYPIWVLSGEFGDGVRVDQVFIDNPSVTASRFGSRPCLLVDLTSNQPSSVSLDGVEFVTTWTQNGVALYEPRAST